MPQRVRSVPRGRTRNEYIPRPAWELRQVGDGYFVDAFGRVYSDRVPGRRTPGSIRREAWFHEQKLHLLPNGYLQANIEGRKRYVHDLVAQAFIGPKPEGMEVRHLDGNRLNNRPENLTYGTHSENARDMVRHGTANFQGSRSPMAKVDDETVRRIWDRRFSGLTYKEMGRQFGVSDTIVRYIVHRQLWKHLDLPGDPAPVRGRDEEKRRAAAEQLLAQWRGGSTFSRWRLARAHEVLGLYFDGKLTP